MDVDAIISAHADRIDRTTQAGRRASCGYHIQQACANCIHVIHSRSACGLHNTAVNLDRGMCRDFVSIESVHESREKERKKKWRDGND